MGLVGAQYTKAAKIGQPDVVQFDKRQPAKFPEPLEGEEFKEFVLRLKEDCPVEQVVIFGQNIPKYMLPPEKFYVENQGKNFFPNVLVRLLTPSQVEAIKERAKITAIHVRPHKDFENAGAPRVKEYFGYASDWILIYEKPQEMIESVNVKEEKKEIPRVDEVTDLKASMYKEQIERGTEAEKKRSKRDGSN